MTREQRLLGAARIALAGEANWFCLLRSAVKAYKEIDMANPTDPTPQESMDGSPAEVFIFDSLGNDSHAAIRFQCGPVKEVGENGTTIEAVVDVLIKRLEGFQKGPFACDYNQEAIHALMLAKDALMVRTQKRMERGVEGTNQL